MDGVLVPWVVATTILLFVAAYWIYTLEGRFKALQGKYSDLLHIADAVSDAPDQAALLPLAERLDGQANRLATVELKLASALQDLSHSVQVLGIVRYNAFEGVGGDMSFSVALVDPSGRGAVITGLHNGDNVRVFAKPVTGWRSSYSLSADEQTALSQARSVVS